MTKRLLLISLIIFATILIAAAARQKEGSRPSTQVSSATAHSRETPGARLIDESPIRSPGQVGDEKKRTTLEVATSSSRTVLARCRSVDVREVAGGNIFTFYEFDVLQELKGRSGESSFTLRLLGGRIGNAEITPVLDVEFVPDRKYVLFLGRENASGYPTISSQSIFLVRTSSLDKREVVVPSPTGLKLYEAKDGRKYSETPELLPLEDFIFSIRKLNR